VLYPDTPPLWQAAGGPFPHWLEVDFAAAVPIGQLRVVAPPVERSPSRIQRLEVQVRDAEGAYRPVWRGGGLEKYPVIAPAWEPQATTGIRLVVHRAVLPWQPTEQAAIEDLLFPGYRVVTPPAP
jgi:hypothetical protein